MPHGHRTPDERADSAAPGVTAPQQPHDPRQLRRVAVASFVGTAIEFYDFYIYGTAAALVIDGAFFPNLSPVNAVLASFSTYAVAFVARPLGSVLFGHFGDRLGRKSVLVVSLLLMGLSTAAVGLLPTYATWGAWAPALLVLLRFLQGLGLGGEWGGAALLAVEHAPAGRRGRYAGFPQLGPSVGFFGATGVFLLLSTWVSDETFRQWAWRVPFLLSLVLVGVGLVVRLQISETPSFRQAAAGHRTARVPIAEILRDRPRELLLGSGAMIVTYGLFYTATTYCLSYGTKTLGIGRTPMLLASMAAVVFLAAGTWLAATRSDALGRRPMALYGTVAAAGWGPLLFPLLDTGRLPLIVLGLGGTLFLMGVIYGPMGAFLPELFPVRLRYSGAGLAYSLGGVGGGAVAPLVATRLQSAFGSASVGWYMSAMAVVSLACLLSLPETRERGLGTSS
ncbi:MHS family MFS transporter [Streptomyces sp. ISL-12]|uniref:MFS transporter n=1 Tax=Streptomyces sp. ISL-12 TaxID=2819177 RepID=UPI001BE5B1C4|nr:MFS transporter [Streptomyces sp. ISL-12]MBT2410999.1 MHS family MFS transporter [Streptomyces sp. ISL-12]